MTTTPKLEIVHLTEGQTIGSELAVNDGFNKLDAVYQCNALSRSTTSPPGSPAAGDTYLVPASATGAWSGEDGNLAVYISGWFFITPTEGFTLWIADEDIQIVYTGSAWISVGSRGQDFYRQVGTSPVERWYSSSANGTALTTGVPAVDTLIATPFIAGRGGTLDRIAFNVTSGGGGGSSARVGIYRNSSLSNLYPGALLLDAGDKSTTGSGVKNATINQALRPGELYWLAYLAGVSAPTVRSHAVAGLPPILGLDNGLGTTPGLGWSVSQAYGSLPDPFPGSASVLVAAPVPAVFVRFSA